jgi:hypothetical protein
MNIREHSQSVLARLARARLRPMHAALGLFELFSMGSTGYGLHAFFNGFGEFAPWVGWAIVFAIAVGLHSLAIGWFYRFRETRRLVALAPYVLLSSIFIDYSWSWHWAQFEAPAVSQADYDLKRGDLARALYNETAAIQLVANKTQSLADYSDARATEENKHGGTCGDASGGTRGKRFQVRMSDKNEAHDLAEESRRRLALLEALGGRIHGLPSDPAHRLEASRALDDIATELSAFANADPVIADIRSRVAARLRLSHEGYRIPGYGLVRCPDPARDGLLEGVLAAAKMPPVSFERVLDPGNISEAQKRIWGRAANTVAAAWHAVFGGRLDPAVAGEVLTFPDYVALITAAFVEGAVLLSMLLLPRPRRRAETWAARAASLNDRSARNLFAAMRRLATGGTSANHALLSLIERHLWWLDANADPFLVVPIAPQEQASSELFRIGELMIDLGMARVPHSYSSFCGQLRRRPDAPAHLAALARSSVLRLYRVDRHAYRQLMLMLLFDDDSAPPPSPPQQPRAQLLLPPPARVAG